MSKRLVVLRTGVLLVGFGALLTTVQMIIANNTIIIIVVASTVIIAVVVIVHHHISLLTVDSSGYLSQIILLYSRW